LSAPTLAPLAVVVGTGIAFLLFVTWFTNASGWMLELTTLNRATLHLAPLVVVLGVLLWRELTAEAASSHAPAAQRASA
jgi:H+/Cl- antiporter ClcA